MSLVHDIRAHLDPGLGDPTRHLLEAFTSFVNDNLDDAALWREIASRWDAQHPRVLPAKKGSRP